MIHYKRTNAGDTIFKALERDLDDELSVRDGDEHSFYAQYNKTDESILAIIGFDEEGNAVSIGALKPYEPGIVEIKRMFVVPENRGTGIASEMLQELEDWAIELGYNSAILETGNKQPEAIGLYKKCNYEQIENYGQYTAAKNSLCFKKILQERV